jgi:predicted site-specific integrase-resolvase
MRAVFAARLAVWRLLMGKRIIVPKDFAEAFGVAEDTVREWAKSGKLPPPLPGFRRLRWRWQDVQHLFGEKAVS